MDIDWRQETHAPAPGTVLCKLNDLEPGAIREFQFGADKPFRLLVYRKGDAVYAYVNQCPHHWLPMNKRTGGFLVWAEDEMMCVHHSAVFNLVDGGRCSMGPCLGSNLTIIPLRVTAGQVSIE